jgi:Transposase
MIIVGCDFHPAWQQIVVFDSETGEITEHKLMNGNGEAKQFYQELPAPLLIGIEACGNSQWFVDLLQRLGHEVWIGDAAQIRASYVRKQKTDRRDAAHILKLLMEGRFPRLWMPGAEERDLRQLIGGSAQTSCDPYAGKRWTATSRVEPWSAEEKQLVDRGRAEGAARAGAGHLGGLPARGFAGTAGQPRQTDRQTRRSRGTSS